MSSQRCTISKNKITVSLPMIVAAVSRAIHLQQTYRANSFEAGTQVLAETSGRPQPKLEVHSL